MTQNDTHANNMRGALFMAASNAGYAINDASVKLVGDAMPLAQLVFLRGVVTTLMIAAAVRWIGAIRFTLPWREWRIILVRSLADLGSTVCFIIALINMPLANVTAILQALPLTVALGAALFLREPLGWRRLLAIGVGFIGVLLIVRPGTDAFDSWALWALGAVAFITWRDLAARRLAPETPSSTVAFTTAALITLAAGVAMVFTPWAPVSTGQASLLLLAALGIVFAYVGGVATMRVGEIGFSAPFRYTGLIFALILGLVVFGDWPDTVTLFGAALVVGTGLFTLYRERQKRRGPARPQMPGRR